LSGNALISIICTIAPTVKCFEESNNTLKFATRAKKIKMEARVNETVDDKTLLRAYRLEIEQLKAKLAEVESVMQLKVSEQQPDGVDTEESQLLMLQMIDHMERLILKGEEKAKEEESAKDRKSIEPKREMRSRKSEGMKSTNSSRRMSAEAASNPSPSAVKKESPVATNRNGKREANTQVGESKPGAASPRPTPRESKIAQRKTNKKPAPPKKSLTMPNPPTTTAVDLAIAPETTELEPCPDNDESEMESLSNSLPANRSPRAPQEDDSEEEQEDFFAGINRNRESVLRASHDANDSQSPASQARKMLSSQSFKDPDGATFPSLIESILSGSRESLMPSVGSVDRDKVKDPVLHGVSQMLGLLKQHVQKPKYASPPPIPLTDSALRQSLGIGAIEGAETLPKARGQRRSATNLPQLLEETDQAKAELVHQLRMELHLKDADNRFLQGELEKSNEQINAKDNMLSMLTEGLKEVPSLPCLPLPPDPLLPPPVGGGEPSQSPPRQ
jgi:hypothetical protein